MAKRRAAKAEIWKKHIERKAALGLSDEAYAKREGLKKYQVWYWRTKLSAEPRPSAFVRVAAATSTAAPAGGLRISLPGGVCLEAAGAIDAKAIAALVRELGAGT